MSLYSSASSKKQVWEPQHEEKSTDQENNKPQIKAVSHQTSSLTPAVPLIGRTPVMQQLFGVIDRIASANSSVVITGATGTGKEVIARAIHERSSRCTGPFIDINCSAIPDTLFEAELFGHQRGTFTGAHDTRRGLLEEASGGTLFLDEVDALSTAAQAKLLRVLQERQLRRVGGRENISIDVRIISATNRDLQAAVTESKFRPDLFFRLRVVPLHVPELRERVEDIPLLVEHFLQRHAERRSETPRRFAPEAMHTLTDAEYHWPGNVRELENAVEYALAISDWDELTTKDLPPSLLKRRSEGSKVLGECLLNNASLAEVERHYILSMFERHHRHQIRTASALGIDRRTLYRKLTQYGAIGNGGNEPAKDSWTTTERV